MSACEAPGSSPRTRYGSIAMRVRRAVRARAGGPHAEARAGRVSGDQLADGCELERGNRFGRNSALRIDGGWPVIAAQGSKGRGVNGSGLSKRLDRGGPPGSLRRAAVL